MCDNRLAGEETFEAAQHPFISQTVIDSLTSCGEGGSAVPPPIPTQATSTLLHYFVIG